LTVAVPILRKESPLAFDEPDKVLTEMIADCGPIASQPTTKEPRPADSGNTGVWLVERNTHTHEKKEKEKEIK